MIFIEKKITKDSPNEVKEKLISSSKGCRFLIKDANRGPMDVCVYPNDAGSYKVVRVWGLVPEPGSTDETCKIERLSYSNLQQAYQIILDATGI